mgnify:CR=1 FL=1
MPQQYKIDKVAEIESRIAENAGLFVVNYNGLTVKQAQELRHQLRECGAEMKVYKNNLVRIALEKAEMPAIDDCLEGPVACVFYDSDPAAAAKVIKEQSEKLKKMSFIGGIADGKALSADEAKAFGVISMGSAIAALSKATKVIVKTPHEAVGIPTMEANAEGLRCTKQVINMLRDQEYNGAAVAAEKEIIRAETVCILEKCLELGGGDIAVGVCRGVESGALDVPFAPCRANAGLMLPARDNNGAVRILNTGNLPFTQDIKDFHREKLEERARQEKRQVSFQMVIDDVYAIGKGWLVGRPRH